MHLVLLSGGSGKRLWPLSNGIRAKAYLRLLPAPDGGTESMLQRVCRQLEAAGLAQRALIVTHESQIELTLHQIGGRIPILGESYRRGTFPAVALAAAHLASSGGVHPDETVAFMPVDAYADDAFFAAISRLPNALSSSGAELALIGAQPMNPSTEYGYIEPEAPVVGQDFRKIRRFIEKPDRMTADGLIERGALWNCGVFAFKLGYLLGQLRQRNLPDRPEELQPIFRSFGELAFDREIAERSSSAVVVPFTGIWSDLGSWETLSGRLGSRVIGPGSVAPDCGDTQLVNQLPIPIHVIGAEDLIVAAGADGVLVAAKDAGSRIKEAIAGGGDGASARIEEKRWGTRTVLDLSGGSGDCRTRTSRIRLFAGTHTSCHRHPDRTEVLYIFSGEGSAMVDGSIRPIRGGDVLKIGAGISHGIRADSALEYIEIHAGTFSSPSGVCRIALDW